MQAVWSLVVISAFVVQGKELLAENPKVWKFDALINKSTVAALMKDVDQMTQWGPCVEQENTFPMRRCVTIPPSTATKALVDKLEKTIDVFDRTQLDSEGLAVIRASAGAPPVGIHNDARYGDIAFATAVIYLDLERTQGTEFPFIDLKPDVGPGDMLKWDGVFPNGTINPLSRHKTGSPSTERTIIQIPFLKKGDDATILLASSRDASMGIMKGLKPPLLFASTALEIESSASFTVKNNSESATIEAGKTSLVVNLHLDINEQDQITILFDVRFAQRPEGETFYYEKGFFNLVEGLFYGHGDDDYSPAVTLKYPQSGASTFTPEAQQNLVSALCKESQDKWSDAQVGGIAAGVAVVSSLSTLAVVFCVQRRSSNGNQNHMAASLL